MRVWQEGKRMHIKNPVLAALDGAGCAYLCDLGAPGGAPSGALGAAGAAACGEPRLAASAYCPEHHALCHLAPGSAEEARRLREIEALAQAVGGRLGRDARSPPDALLRRWQRLERAFSRPQCSRYVHR